MDAWFDVGSSGRKCTRVWRPYLESISPAAPACVFARMHTTRLARSQRYSCFWYVRRHTRGPKWIPDHFRFLRFRNDELLCGHPGHWIGAFQCRLDPGSLLRKDLSGWRTEGNPRFPSV